MSLLTTTLEPAFLQAQLRVSAYKHADFVRAQCHLVARALQGYDVMGSDLGPDLTKGSPTLAGCCAGSLCALGLLVAIGRAKSRSLAANGRKANVYRLANDKIGAARAFLRANGYQEKEEQTLLFG